METVKNRRSIRKYAGKPVDEGLLRRLLEVSERTQTMGNMQLSTVRSNGRSSARRSPDMTIFFHF